MNKGRVPYRSDKWLADEINKAIAEADHLRAECLRSIKRRQDADKLAAWWTVTLVAVCIVAVGLLAAIVAAGAGQLHYDAIRTASDTNAVPLWALWFPN